MAIKSSDGQKPSGGPKASDASKGVSTVSTMVERIAPKEQMSDSSNFADPAKLRDSLAKCTMSPHASENPTMVILENFINNMQGAKSLSLHHYKLGNIAVFGIHTRSGVFLLSSYSPAALYEDPVFMTLKSDLKLRTVIYRPDGAPLYLYPLGAKGKNGAKDTKGSEEFEKLEGYAAKQKGRQSLPPPAPKAEITDTLEIANGNGASFSTEGFKKRFARCQVLDGSDFDPKAFAESIHFMSTFRDMKGSSHYVIVAGENQDGYRLYVNADSTVMPGEGITLQYGKGDYCLLYKELDMFLKKR
ncbi:MAG: hypothetical protein PHF60_04435 [Candidatus ainarchaeum sp.]|nr:hypothetical protein [Candidatus ainarchaeum sp.]